MNSQDAQITKQEAQNPSVHQIVEHFLPDVTWTGADGYCKCPGEKLHTHASGKRDCKVYVTGRIPTVSCFHSHCWEIVQDMNRQIREVWDVYAPRLPDDVVAAAREKSAKKKMLIETARALKPQILETYKWSLADMKKEIGYVETTPESLIADWKQHLKLFTPEDVLWVGEPDSTGRAIYSANWRRQLEFAYMPEPMGNFTSASVFKRGIWSRSNANVVSSPYLVIECDDVLGIPMDSDEARTANKDACGAIFRWMRESLGMTLHQVVDTGNKSLHGWFTLPPANVYEELKVVLPEIGADRATFKPSQPVRCPGAVRELSDGRKVGQRIVWRAVK